MAGDTKTIYIDNVPWTVTYEGFPGQQQFSPMGGMQGINQRKVKLFNNFNEVKGWFTGTIFPFSRTSGFHETPEAAIHDYRCHNGNGNGADEYPEY